MNTKTVSRKLASAFGTAWQFGPARILDAAQQSLGRRPDRIADRSANGAMVKFAWRPDENIDPLNFSEWYHLNDLGIYA